MLLFVLIINRPELRRFIRSEFQFLRNKRDPLCFNAILDDLSDAAAYGEVDENDPRSIARWARKMGHAYGDELGDDYNEMVDRMEAGELDDDAEGGAGDDFADAPFD